MRFRSKAAPIPLRCFSLSLRAHLRPWPPDRRAGESSAARSKALPAFASILLILCLYVCPAPGQDCGGRSFYPLAVDNYWVYLEWRDVTPAPDTIVVEVYGDTLIEGHIWFKLKETNSEFQTQLYSVEFVQASGEVYTRDGDVNYMKYPLGAMIPGEYWIAGVDTARFDSCVTGEYVGVTGRVIHVSYRRPGGR